MSSNQFYLVKRLRNINCSLCKILISYLIDRHLRERHCTREGGSFVCHYGYKGVCTSSPVVGVSDQDYVEHVKRYHMSHTQEPPEQWSVYMAAQNLPAVLNDPSRGKQSNIFTKKWGDSFVEKVHISPTPMLPEITFTHLDTYIRQIGKRYRRHLRLNQNIQLREQTQSQAPSVVQQNGRAVILSIPQEPTSSQKSITNIEVNDAKLSEIPQIFIKNNLDFNNTEIFEEVFPGVTDSDNHSSGRLLQERLSHYLDIVEVLIAKQVLFRNNCNIFIIMII